MAQWVGNVTSSLAGVFGMSKPSNKGTVSYSKLTSAKYMSNYQGEDQSHKLGLSAENEICGGSFAGSEIDEMALQYVAGTPNFFREFNWSTSNSTNTVLFAEPINPNKYLTALNSSNFVLTHLGFIASSFSLWRGSIDFIFKVVKTQFHSGRLRFVYAPGVFQNTLAGIDINQCHSFIMDLRTQSEITVSCPYQASTPWLYVRDQELGVTPIPYDNSVGTLFCVVINELRAAPTVSPDVNILTEVAGGRDIAFSIPVDPKWCPWNQIHVTNVVVQGQTELTRTDYQGGVVRNAFDTIGAQTVTPEKWTIGETITSIRQLIKRFSFSSNPHRTLADDETAAGWIPGLDSNNAVYVKPYVMVKPQDDASLVPVETALMDYLDYYSMPFVFMRGSMRFKFEVDNIIAPVASGAGRVYEYNNNWLKFKLLNSWVDLNYPDLNSAAWTANQLSDGKSFAGPAARTVSSGNSIIWLDRTSTVVVATNIEGMSEIEVPFYSKGHMIPVDLPRGGGNDAAMNFDEVARGTFPSSVLMMYTSNSRPGSVLTQPIDVKIYRAAGDDFSFGFLIGMPMVVEMSLRNIDNIQNST